MQSSHPAPTALAGIVRDLKSGSAALAPGTARHCARGRNDIRCKLLRVAKKSVECSTLPPHRQACFSPIFSDSAGERGGTQVPREASAEKPGHLARRDTKETD